MAAQAQQEIAGSPSLALIVDIHVQWRIFLLSQIFPNFAIGF